MEGVFLVFNVRVGVRKLPNTENTPTRACSWCSAVEGVVVEATNMKNVLQDVFFVFVFARAGRDA